MVENLKWLWAAFSIAWALHIGYLAVLSRRTRSVQSQIGRLARPVERALCRSGGRSRTLNPRSARIPGPETLSARFP